MGHRQCSMSQSHHGEWSLSSDQPRIASRCLFLYFRNGTVLVSLPLQSDLFSIPPPSLPGMFMSQAVSTSVSTPTFTLLCSKSHKQLSAARYDTRCCRFDPVALRQVTQMPTTHDVQTRSDAPARAGTELPNLHLTWLMICVAERPHCTLGSRSLAMPLPRPRPLRGKTCLQTTGIGHSRDRQVLRSRGR